MVNEGSLQLQDPTPPTNFFISSRSRGGKREWPDHVSFHDSGTSRCRAFVLQAVCQRPVLGERDIREGLFQAFSDSLHLNRLERIRGEIET